MRRFVSAMRWVLLGSSQLGSSFTGPYCIVESVSAGPASAFFPDMAMRAFTGGRAAGVR